MSGLIFEYSKALRSPTFLANEHVLGTKLIYIRYVILEIMEPLFDKRCIELANLAFFSCSQFRLNRYVTQSDSASCLNFGCCENSQLLTSQWSKTI